MLKKQMKDTSLSQEERIGIGETLLSEGIEAFTCAVKKRAFEREIMQLMEGVRTSSTVAASSIDHHVEDLVVSSDDGHVEVLEDFTDNSDKESGDEESDKEPEEDNHNKTDKQTIPLEHHTFIVARMDTEMQALKKRLGDAEEQLKEARSELKRSQSNFEIIPYDGRSVPPPPLEDECRPIPSTLQILHLTERRLEEANDLADKRVEVHMVELKKEHDTEIKLLKAKHDAQMNSMESWEEKWDAYQQRITEHQELTSRNRWLEEQLEGYKAQTKIKKLSEELKLDPRNYAESIRVLCERNHKLQKTIDEMNQSRGTERSAKLLVPEG